MASVAALSFHIGRIAMAEDTGKGAYGVRHVMEDGMRKAGQGVFEPKSGAVGTSDGSDDAPQALSGLNKSELLDTAEAEGVEADDSMTKVEIVAAIEKARG